MNKKTITTVLFFTVSYSFIFAQPDSTQNLIERLKSSDEQVRLNTVSALGEIKDEAVIPPLIETLKNDEQKEIRFAASQALIKIGKPAVLPLLKIVDEELVKPEQNPRIIFGVTYTLGLIKDERVVPYLFKLAKNKDENVANEAIRAAILLGQEGNKETIPLLIEGLRNNNAEFRTGASWALAEIADPSTLKPLMTALKDDDWRVRENAARGLGAIKNEDAVTPLIEALKDNQKEVRHASALALGKIGQPTVPALLKILDDELVKPTQNMTLTHATAIALSSIKDKRAIPYLFKLVKNQDGNISIYATEALCNMGDDQIVFDLMKMAAQEAQKIDKEKAEEIAKENRDGLSKLADLSGLVATSINISSGIANVGEPMIPVLLKALSNSDWEVRSMSVSLLGELSMSYPAYKQTVVESLISKIDDNNEKVRMAISDTLKSITNAASETGKDFGQDKEKWQEWWGKNKENFNTSLGQDEAEAEVMKRYDFSSPQASFESYKKAIQKEDLEGVIIHSWELGKRMIPTMAGAWYPTMEFKAGACPTMKLKDVLAPCESKPEYRDRWFKEANLLWTWTEKGDLKVTEADFVKELERTHIVDNLEKVPVTICEIIVARKSDGAQATVRAYNVDGTKEWWIFNYSGEVFWPALLYCPLQAILGYSVRGVGESGKVSVTQIPFLISMLGDDYNFPTGIDGSSSPSAEAASTLVKIGKPAVKPLITALKEENKEWARMYAASTLGAIADPCAIEPLIEALKSDKSWLVRESAAYALGDIRDRRAVEPLIVALKDEDWNVRMAAVYVLGKIRDPRAIEPLMEALNDKSEHVRGHAKVALEEIRGISK